VTTVPSWWLGSPDGYLLPKMQILAFGVGVSNFATGRESRCARCRMAMNERYGDPGSVRG
jgi:hypothetical protein